MRICTRTFPKLSGKAEHYPMSSALLTIGTELTRGDLQNTNTTWLAERLTSLGYEVTEMVTVDDDDERIQNTLSSLSERHQVIVSTGGLGPTTDDRTSACAARVLQVPLVRDEASLTKIRELFEKFGRTMSASNEKQADFPQGATILGNQKGTAPGFFCKIGPCSAFFLPGVPREMSAMFDEQVVPLLPVRNAPFTTVRLRTFGMPEAEVNDHLSGLEEQHDVTIGYRASHSDIEVKVLATGKKNESECDLKTRAEGIADEVVTRLGDVVYERGERHLPAVVGDLLISKGVRLALAESCTGGLLSQWITEVPGASRYYQGGVVSYANSAKTGILGVSELLLERHGAVSEPVARAMAEGAKRVLRADYSIAITGVAGPTGGTQEKPVGLVHWAVSTPQNTFSKHRVFFGDRAQIQRRAATFALHFLLQALTGKGDFKAT